jgi:Tol biopolymer transport system component
MTTTRMREKSLKRSRREMLTILVTSVIAFSIGVTPQAAGGTADHGHVATTQGGLLTFMRKDSAEFWQVWVANTDLTGQRQLTHEAANSGWPVWSPDGRNIAFDTDRGDPDPGDATVINDIFTMNPDGSGLKNLTGSKDFSGDAGWSPDGSLIAFDSDRGDYPAQQGIYVMNRDGTDARRVTSLPSGASNDLAPRFAPDSRHLVFTRYGGDEDFGNSALFTVDIRGRHLLQVTTFAIGAGDADWSPDGNRIVFEASPSPTSHGDIYTMNANGRHLRNLTLNQPPNGSADPVWSPDGRKILFLQAILHDNQFTAGLATMKPDGSDRHFISSTPMVEHQPDWQPTCRKCNR